MSVRPDTLIEYLREFSPWPRLRRVHQNVVPDILSGITVAFIALPLALGFGVASGLGPVAGMYGAISGGLAGGLFGGLQCRRQRSHRPQDRPARHDPAGAPAAGREP